MATIVDVNRVVTTNLSVTGVSTFVDVDTSTINGINYPNAGPLSNRNLIINGAMQVSQRGTQETSVTTSAVPQTCDRFHVWIGTLGTWTIDQSTDAPDGFSSSLKATCTTADSSPTGSDYAFFNHRIEAQNLQHLNYGSSAAQELTLSFWVKSNKTGNATVALLQRDNSNKLLSPQYTISSADTWEYKTISIPADTSGAINNDNGIGLDLEFVFNSGPDYSGGNHQTTWSAYNGTNRYPSLLGVGGATSDYFAITGVQLEVGTVATPFEHRSFGDELARCQRYYEKSYDIGDAPGTANGRGAAATRRAGGSEGATVFNDSFKVRKRDIPNIVWYNPNNGTSGQIHNISVGAITVTGTSTSAPTSETKPGAPTHAGNGSQAQIIVGHWTADAEL